MGKNLSENLYKFSQVWVALLALIVFLGFTILVLPKQAEKAKAETSDIGSPDLSFYYSADDLYKMAEAYGEEGRVAYVKARFTFDLIWPLVYTLFLVTAISALCRKIISEKSKWRRINLLPLIGALFDLLENASTSLVMARYPGRTAVIDVLASIFTMIKWVYVNLSFVALLIVLVLAIIRSIKAKRNK